MKILDTSRDVNLHENTELFVIHGRREKKLGDFFFLKQNNSFGFYLLPYLAGENGVSIETQLPLGSIVESSMSTVAKLQKREQTIQTFGQILTSSQK